MPELKRYTVTKIQKVAISATSPENAIRIASEEELALDWETTDIDASKDY